MEPKTKKILIGVGTAIAIIIIALIIAFVALYIHLMMKHSALHEDLNKCTKVVHNAATEQDAMNVTMRFLRPPEEYKALAEKCRIATDCVKSVDLSAADDVLGMFKPCLFYIYYANEFADCANKLIAVKDNVSCLDTLFNDKYEPDVDECKQWEGMQPCIKHQIGEVCGDTMGKMRERYAVESINFRASFCRDPTDTE